MNQPLVGVMTKSNFRRASALLQAAVLAVAGIIPFLVSSNVSAATLADRSATIDKSAISSSDVEFLFGYDLQDTTNTKAGIIYEFCTTPLGSCTLPTGMDVQTANVHDAQSAWPSNATAFTASTEAADVGDCTNNADAFMLCYERDETVATLVTGGPVTHTISGITAPSAIQSVYIRISVFSNDDFLTVNLLDQGIVAVAFVDQLTINGRVQERLDFCVAAIDDDDSLPVDVATCAALTDSVIDLGVIDNTNVVVSPEEPTLTNGSDDDYGILMVNTNASGGVVVAYYPEDPSAVSGADTHQLKSFRVVPTDCDASAASVVDQCFVSASGVTAETIAAGTERFGIQVPCVDSTQGAAPYTFNLAPGVPNLYNNVDNDASEAANCENEAVDAGLEFGWNATGTADTLASSTTVVDDEIVKIRFGATASATTPTGTYTVVTTYIATPKF